MGDEPARTTQTETRNNIPIEAKPLADALARLGISNIGDYGSRDAGYSAGYRTELDKMAGGYYLDPATNPTLAKREAAIDTNAAEAFSRALADSQSAAAKAGGLLGVKSRVASAEAGRRVASDAAAAKANLEASNYATERGNQLTALEKQYALFRQPLTDALEALARLTGTSGTSVVNVEKSGGGFLGGLI
ncbi:MAG: hypothetical protein HZC54_00645 [Verrucomicrobia bacterium]|nr:hypothetical protein [Verrucomicrobiota bacterium]